MRYWSWVGDMGSTLSGGQKQRILLARALYQEPELLILDEGTANLDPQIEARIVEAVARLMITRVVVAHHPSLVSRADRVISVDGGFVTDVQGSPDVIAGRMSAGVTVQGTGGNRRFDPPSG